MLDWKWIIINLMQRLYEQLKILNLLVLSPKSMKFLRPTKSNVKLFLVIVIVTTMPVIARMNCTGGFSQVPCSYPLLGPLVNSSVSYAISFFSPFFPIFFVFGLGYLAIAWFILITLFDYFICCVASAVDLKVQKHKNRER